MRNELRLRAGSRFFRIQERELERVLQKPIRTLLLTKQNENREGMLLSGLLYEGGELIPLLDPSGGELSQRPDFGQLCVLLESGGRRLAVAVEELHAVEETAEPDSEERVSVQEWFQWIYQEGSFGSGSDLFLDGSEDTE